MMKRHSWPEIVEIMNTLQAEDDGLKRRMIDVRDRYNGFADSASNWVLPIDSSLEGEQLDPLIPTLVSEAIDQLAMRAGSVIPGVVCPQLQPGKDTGRRSREYANYREKAIYEAYERSRFNLGMRRMFRHYGGYASMAAAVMPNRKLGVPQIKVMDPLSAYPEPRAPEEVQDPSYCGFIFGKSASFLYSVYPMARQENGGPIPAQAGQNEQMWDCCLFVDEVDWVMGIVGPRPVYENTYTDVRHGKFMEIFRQPHGLPEPPFFVANKVTMDKVISQIVNVTGLVDLKARLMRLQLAAAERAVFPDKYILADEMSNVVVNDGKNKWLDGRSGDVNVILGARGIGNLPGTPDQSAIQLADRFERDFRVSTGLVPQVGGETYGALRTGRGIDALMGEAVDPRVQEMQEVMEGHLPRINRAVLACYEKDFGESKIWLFPGYAGDVDAVEFRPKEHVEGHYLNRVRYAITGAGVEATNITIQQMVASELLSRETAREMHPYIRGSLEKSRITTEKLQQAVEQGILQQVMAGGMPPIMAAFIAQEQKEDPEIDIFEALRRADEKMRALQAQEQQAQGPDPAAAPGIAPGAPAGPMQPPQQLPPGIAPTPGLEGLREVNNAIAASQRVVGA